MPFVTLDILAPPTRREEGFAPKYFCVGNEVSPIEVFVSPIFNQDVVALVYTDSDNLSRLNQGVPVSALQGDFEADWISHFWFLLSTYYSSSIQQKWKNSNSYLFISLNSLQRPGLIPRAWSPQCLGIQRV